MKKVFIYPFWLRFWHWFNALLFFVLIISGISLHYADSNLGYLSYKQSMYIHNISGILLTLNYLMFIIFSIITGNIKHYIPKLKGLWHRVFLQVRFYFLGIFLNEYHPFYSTKENKFNPIQQITYFIVMLGMLPLLIISGWLMLFPEYAPDQILGIGGVWPMAFLHILTGLLLSLFMLVHIYLGTTGNTVLELFKSMITGWHLEPEMDDNVIIANKKDEVYLSPIARIKKTFPKIFYNPITIVGALMSIISFILIILLSIIEFLTVDSNPYLGIITYIGFPSFLLIGLLLIALGAIVENRRILSQKGEKRLPIIDLNNPKHQITTLVFSVITIIIVVLSVFGSFKAYEYTDSDEFCGQVCHKVMSPEYTSYKNSPHSRVGCVKCHIGSGAGWFVRSKISGSYQVYSVLFNKYSRPIPTPVEALRPASGTCEQCHWPRYFHDDKKLNKKYFLLDEKNSEYDLSFIIKINGGAGQYIKNNGIHYVMNIANDISYLPLDRQRNIIPWVKVVSKIDGSERVFRDTSISFDEKLLKSDKVRKMDCIDCHNRPSHIIKDPYSQVNKLMAQNIIKKDLPYIKKVSIQALDTYTLSRDSAYNDISAFVYSYYKNNYPDIYKNRRKDIKMAIGALHDIYMKNYFPEMKVNWKKYTQNLGHKNSPGCFRCHDGKHVSSDGKVISNDCNICHAITYQKLPGQEAEISSSGLKFKHPGGISKLDNLKSCIQCHGAFPNKKEVIRLLK